MIKFKCVEGFFKVGDKVKVMIFFCGCEQLCLEQGVCLLCKFVEDVVEFGMVEFNLIIDGCNMVMVVVLFKSKFEVKQEQNVVCDVQCVDKKQVVCEVKSEFVVIFVE